jgi:hypothetical protein
LIACLISLIVDEQLKELKKLLEQRIPQSYHNPSDTAYYWATHNNRSRLYEVSRKLDPENVAQHRALITQSVQQKLRPLINYQ